MNHSAFFMLFALFLTACSNEPEKEKIIVPKRLADVTAVSSFAIEEEKKDEKGFNKVEISGEKEYVWIFSGQKSTGGHTISVVKVEKKQNQTTVITVKETAPSSEMVHTMALTYPYTTVTIPKSKKLIVKDASGRSFYEIKENQQYFLQNGAK